MIKDLKAEPQNKRLENEYDLESNIGAIVQIMGEKASTATRSLMRPVPPIGAQLTFKT